MMRNYKDLVLGALASAGLVAAALVGVSGCAADLDTRRESVDTGSFGTTVVTLVCKRMAYLDDLADGDGRVDVRGDRYREICREGLAVPADASAELAALQAKRALLIEAIDSMWPEDFLDEVQAYATSDAFLAGYDDGTVTAGVEALRDILRVAAERDDALAVLESLAQRRGYSPASAGAVYSLLGAPQLEDVLLHTTGDLAPGGSAHAAVTLLAAAAAIELRAAEISMPGEPGQDPEDDPLGPMLLDLLLRERDDLGTGQPMLLVRRDARGLAVIAQQAPGVLPEPFVDQDGDGLADVDERGRFIDSMGAVIAAPPPFVLASGEGSEDPRDELGRALDSTSGEPLYEYIDLDRTLLAALLRDGAALLDPGLGTGIDLVRGAGALLGPRETVTRTYDTGEMLSYQGFDTDRSALLDMLYGALQLLRDPGIYDLLALGRELVGEQEPALAQLAEALIDAARAGDAPEFAGAALEPGSPLWDDLVPVVRQIVEVPGLFEDLMKAMEDPRVAELGTYFRDYMTYSDVFAYAPGTQEVVATPAPAAGPAACAQVREQVASGMVVPPFSTKVDRSAANSGFNRSVMQRVLHLLADTDGARLCNKADTKIMFDDAVLKTYDEECELLQIDNLAVFYLQSVAYARDAQGNFIEEEDGTLRRKAEFVFNWQDPRMDVLVTDEAMELFTEIEGFRHHPTPQALNRTLFLLPRSNFLVNIIDPPLSKHGERLEDLHCGGLPGWEIGGFYDALQPLVQPFADHDAEQLFVDLLVVLHKHWPARDSADHQQLDPEAPGYAWASNVASYEPIIAEVLDRGLLLSGLVEHAPTLNSLSVNGKSTADILGAAARYLLTPQPGLAKRSGDTTTTTADGRPVPELSPWHILADAYALKKELQAAAGERGEAWSRAVSQAVDALARGENSPESGGWRFRNPRLRGVGLTLVDFLVERLEAHDAAGDREAWLTMELPADVEDILAGPLVAGASDLVDAMSQNVQGRKAVEGLLAHGLNEARDADAFRAMVAMLADAMQLVIRDEQDMVPLAHLAGEVLEPSKGWLDPLLAMGRSAGQADTEGVLAQTLRNLFAPYHPGRTPVGDLIDGIGEVYRAQPLTALDAPYTQADYRAMFEKLAAFLDEEKRGLPKFIGIIQQRRKP